MAELRELHTGCSECQGSDCGTRSSASLTKQLLRGKLAGFRACDEGSKATCLCAPCSSSSSFPGSSTFVDLRRALHAEDPPLLVRGQIRSVHEACSLSHLSFASRTFQQLLGDLKCRRCGTHDNTSQRTGQMVLAWCERQLIACQYTHACNIRLWIRIEVQLLKDTSGATEFTTRFASCASYPTRRLYSTPKLERAYLRAPVGRTC